MTAFRNFNNNTGKRVLDLLEAGDLRLRLLANVNYVRYYAIARPSVCLSVCLSSVTFVPRPPTQALEIFGNISTALGTLAIR